MEASLAATVVHSDTPVAAVTAELDAPVELATLHSDGQEDKPGQYSDALDLAVNLDQVEQEASASLDQDEPAGRQAQLGASPQEVESRSEAKSQEAIESEAQSLRCQAANHDQDGSQEERVIPDPAGQEVSVTLDRAHRAVWVNYDQDEHQEERLRQAHRCNTRLKRESMPLVFYFRG